MIERMQQGSGKRPTMVDVAREAGVALRTVSRVVNQDPTVGPEFAERVRAAIDALGYQPDERARQLRSGTSGLLGAVLGDLSGAHPVLTALERSARTSHLMVLSASTHEDDDLERDVVLAMCRRRVDGIILEPIGTDHAYLGPELDAGMPFVAVDRPIVDLPVDAVLSDNVGGITAAFEHLARHGHRRIAYIGDHERIFTGHERASTFRTCLAAHGVAQESLVHTGEVAPKRIGDALRDALSGTDPATAFITGNWQATFEILQHLGAEAQRTAIVGFDDFRFASLLQPGLTVIAQDTDTIGQTAVDLLTDRIADPARDPRRVTVPVSLIARGSGELPPAR
jgi:LacI family transcriptional regulator